MTPPTCQTEPICQTLPIDKGLPTSIVPPIPKPKIGQGRVGIRRQPKVALPTPKPIQTPAPRAVQSLPEPVVQLQERTLLNIIYQQYQSPLFTQPPHASHSQ